VLGEAHEFLIQKIDIVGQPSGAEHPARNRPGANEPDQTTIHYTQLAELPLDSPIYREWETYRRELPRLLAEGHEGKFALIRGEVVVGTFADEKAAFARGYALYLLQGFMVQPIREREPLMRLPWCCLPCHR